MSLKESLYQRANSQCELCTNDKELVIYSLPPNNSDLVSENILVCQKCSDQLNKTEQLDFEHWSDLPNNMWSEVPAVQVVAWRMLNRLRTESWATDALDILYLDDELLEWAKQTGDHVSDGMVEFHKDSLGTVLSEGDNVVLTKTLDVKGSSIRATLGTVVKNIHLVADNIDQIEGKIDGQTIVILTKFLRKV